MSSPEVDSEVVVTVDGVPRPAVVVATDGDRSLVRFRDAGGHREQWVPTASLVPVEPLGSPVPVLKLVGLGVVALLGLALLLYPGGSDRRLADADPTATPTVRPTATPTTTPTTAPTPGPTSAPSGPVRAVLFGDSFTAGRGLEAGRPTALQVAAQLLGWKATVLGADGTAYTTGGTRGGQPFAVRLAREVRTAPDVLVLQGGASDTSASAAQLTTSANQVLDTLQGRFPGTLLVMMGPVAMEQPPDGQLVRVSQVLAGVAAAQRVPYVDPIARGWITAANAGAYLSATGFYPNAAGHAYLGRRLAEALRPLVSAGRVG